MGRGNRQKGNLKDKAKEMVRMIECIQLGTQGASTNITCYYPFEHIYRPTQ